MTNNVRPKPISGDFFIGTNSKPAHLEEALRQGLLAPDDVLLGIFDGIFFDADGKRVGGLVLNDYLLITTNRIILWARDQAKDFVDHFPLAYVYITQQEQKDTIHGRLKLSLVLPTAENFLEPEEDDKITVTFDYVPLADLDLITSMLTVLGTGHRELLIANASERDQEKAMMLLFDKVFVNQFRNSPNGRPAATQPSASPDAPATYWQTNAPQYDNFGEPEDLMTPLSRLDRPNAPKSRSIPNNDNPYRQNSAPPAPSTRSYRPGDEYRYPSGYDRYDQGVQGYGNGNGYATADSAYGMADEMRRMNNEPEGRSSNGRNMQGADFRAPGTRLREDFNSEGIYAITRAGRVAWDGLDRLRREAEAKLPLPSLQALRDSGMNLHEITDFLNSVNSLLDTIGHNPAARELAMAFITKSNFSLGGNKDKDKDKEKDKKPGQGGKEKTQIKPTSSASSKPGKGEKPTAVDDDDDDDTPPPLKHVPLGGKTPLKVERRKSTKQATPEEEGIGVRVVQSTIDTEVTVQNSAPAPESVPQPEAPVEQVIAQEPERIKVPADLPEPEATPVLLAAHNPESPFAGMRCEPEEFEDGLTGTEKAPDVPALPVTNEAGETPQLNTEPVISRKDKFHLPIKRKNATSETEEGEKMVSRLEDLTLLKTGAVGETN